MQLATVSSNRVPLDIWLSKQLPANESAEWVELRHIRADEHASRIERWHASKAKESPQSAAAEIAHAAQVWADQIQSGPQKFVVALTDSREHALAQFLMTISSSSGLLVGPFSTEAPNLAGVTSQLMRHTEASMRAAIGTTSSAMDRLEKELERKQQRIDVLEARWLETLKVVEELQSRRAERELANMREERKEHRKDFVIEKLAVLLPVAASKLLNHGKAAPPSQDPALQALLGSLDGEQLQKIAQHLRPEQLAALLQVVNLYTGNGNTEAGDTEAPAEARSEAAE